MTPRHPDDLPGVAPSTPGDLSRAVAAVEHDVARAADRLEELEQLQSLVVSATAEDLRDPLAALRLHADLLCEAGAALGPDDRASLEAIDRAVSRLEELSERLVADLLEGAGGAEEALRRWLRVPPGSERVRPASG